VATVGSAALLRQVPASRRRHFRSFSIKKDTGLRPSLLWRSTDLTERGQGQRFGAWAWHGRRREVGVSEISGVRSGAPSPCRRSSLRCRPALWRISGDRHKLLLLRGDDAVANLSQSCFSLIFQISSLQLGASLASLCDHAPWFASSPAQYT